MIGGKAKSKFMNITRCEDTSSLHLELYVGDALKAKGTIVFYELSAIKEYKGDEFGIGISENSIEIFYQEGEDKLLLERFTPESILWHRSREYDGIAGFDNYEELFCYDLLYVGIATKGDSYERLIKGGHHARMDILSNEPQRYPGARVTDEIFLFLFRLEPLYVTSFGSDEKMFDMDFGYNHKQIVADAEKAFVSLLKPQYNSVKFNQYPKGIDGLFNSKLNHYSYSIGEKITFNTPHGKIKGSRDEFMGGFNSKADFIFVDKRTSKLFISGQNES